MSDNQHSPAFILLRKSLMLAAATTLPLVTSLVTILVFQQRFGESAVLTLGMAGNVTGIIVAMSAGSMVFSVRRFAKLRASKADAPSLGEALGQENRSAYLISLLSLLLLVSFAVLVPLGTAIPPGELNSYLLGAALWMMVLPLTQVMYGVLQAFGKESTVLRISLTIFVLQLVIVAVIAFTVQDLLNALLATGLAQSVVALGVLLYRLVLLKGYIGGSLAGAYSLRGTWERILSVPDRILAASDGLVYMGIFAAATYIASLSSVSDGALVALIVSYMRLMVIPLKQFGLVGGRFMLQGVNSGIETVGDVRGAARWPCVVAGLIAAGLSIALLPGDTGWIVAVMTFIQLTLEPYSGISYALGKIIYGPRKLFAHMFILYLIALPLTWLVLILGELNTGVAIWTSIFVTRCVFSLSLSLHISRIHQRLE